MGNKTFDEWAETLGFENQKKETIKKVGRLLDGLSTYEANEVLMTVREYVTSWGVVKTL